MDWSVQRLSVVNWLYVVTLEITWKNATESNDRTRHGRKSHTKCLIWKFHTMCSERKTLDWPNWTYFYRLEWSSWLIRNTTHVLFLNGKYFSLWILWTKSPNFLSWILFYDKKKLLKKFFTYLFFSRSSSQIDFSQEVVHRSPVIIDGSNQINWKFRLKILICLKILIQLIFTIFQIPRALIENHSGSRPNSIIDLLSHQIWVLSNQFFEVCSILSMKKKINRNFSHRDDITEHMQYKQQMKVFRVLKLKNINKVWKLEKNSNVHLTGKSTLLAFFPFQMENWKMFKCSTKMHGDSNVIEKSTHNQRNKSM